MSRSSGWLLPMRILDSYNKSWSNIDNLKNENGETSLTFSSRQAYHVETRYYVGKTPNDPTTQIPNSEHGIYVNSVSCKVDSKQSRSNTSLYKTYPTFKEIHTFLTGVTSSTAIYTGTETGSQNSNSYKTSSKTFNVTTDRISTFCWCVGITYPTGALTTVGYLRNAKVNLNYDLAYYYSFTNDGSVMSSGYIREGTGVTAPTPTKTGYDFLGWYTAASGGTRVCGGGSYTPTAVTTNLYAQWAPKTFTITTAAGTGGTITATSTVNYGGSKTITITPNAGYEIVNVTIDDVPHGSLSTYTFDNVTASHSISVMFDKRTFTITTLSGHGGTITESTPVDYGEDVTIYFTPDFGCIVGSVEVDGVLVSSVPAKITSYTFENATESHTILVLFITLEIPQITSASITPNPVNAGQGYYSQHKSACCAAVRVLLHRQQNRPCYRRHACGTSEVRCCDCTRHSELLRYCD